MARRQNPKNKQSEKLLVRKTDPNKITPKDKQLLFNAPVGKFYQALNELARSKKLWPKQREIFIKARLKEVDMELHNRYEILCGQRRNIERVLQGGNPKSFNIEVPADPVKAQALLEDVIAKIATILYSI